MFYTEDSYFSFMVIATSAVLLFSSILNTLLYFYVHPVKKFLWLSLLNALWAVIFYMMYGYHQLPQKYIEFFPLWMSVLTDLILITSLVYHFQMSRKQLNGFCQFVIYYLVLAIPVIAFFPSLLKLLSLLAVAMWIGALWPLSKAKIKFRNKENQYLLLRSGIFIHFLLISQITLTVLYQLQISVLVAIACIVLFVLSQHLFIWKQQWYEHQNFSKDSLTGLRRLNGFMQRLDEEIQRTQREGKFLFISLVEIENLHQINHEMGYLAGDEAIRNAAKILESSSRNFDLSCRVKGGRFAIAQLVANEADGRKLIQRLHYQMNLKYIHHKNTQMQLHLTLGGIILKPEESVNKEILFQKLEIQIQNAKSRKSRVIMVDNEIIPTLAT